MTMRPTGLDPHQVLHLTGGGPFSTRGSIQTYPMGCDVPALKKDD
jgi:hypothetical protein